MLIEAVLLTGGASRRMGVDKANMLVQGVPQAQRVADSLADAGVRVTVLGREPVPGHGFLQDEEEFGGPLSALSRFNPTADAVFVCSCDMPLFDARIVSALAMVIQDNDVAVPEVNGHRQPLCALYKSTAFSVIHRILLQERASMMRWLEALQPVFISQGELAAAGIDPLCAQSANTPEQFDEMLRLSQH